MFEAIIIGLVEGLTEFLPISSTGHMLIANFFLKGSYSDAFYVLIQVGPIAACTLVFWRDIISFFVNWKNPGTKDYVLKLFVAFFLTGLGGLIAKMCGLKLPETILPVALSVLIGAFVIFAVEYKSKKRTLNSNITWAVVVAIALGQLSAAIFPGASRSGMAIMGALIVGLARPDAVKFAFLVGIPTMFVAGSYELFKEIKAGNTYDLILPESIVAYIVATISAWLSVVWLLKFVQTRNFIPFAWYRIVLGIGLIIFLLLGELQH
ncbi:MAG: undecaprenyl-diphosphate phosphatase [Fibromonadales bacterium]|nr:undecaprenyl-diphosphate phosphatase [Fibromonadales bacterium]